MPTHTVKQGECVGSIAAASGFFWETLWKSPENLDLRRERTNPNHLLPGDEIFIPDLRLKPTPAATQRRHRFRCKGIPAVLRLRLLENGEPRRNQPWTAEFGGQSQRGTTDADGLVELKLDPRTPAVTLRLESGVEYRLQLRELDPIESVSGVQARLANLGYECGPVDGVEGPLLAEAVRQFQEDRQLLEPSGIVDEITRAELMDVYGS